MEALELFHAETFSEWFTRADMSVGVLCPAWEPSPDGGGKDRAGALHTSGRFALGEELHCGAIAAVPFDLVHLDCRPESLNETTAKLVGSNGLAGGNTYEEAVLHGLCELIERDATADIAMKEELDPVAGRRPVNWASVTDEGLQDLYARCLSRGLDIQAFDITTRIGIPCFYCRILDRSNPHAGIPVATDGSGCHVHPANALARAIKEAIQTRLLLISGARDDIRSRYYFGRNLPPELPHESEMFNGARISSTGGIKAALSLVLKQLKRAGYEFAVAVDLRSRSNRLHFVRVVVPGLRNAARRPWLIRRNRKPQLCKSSPSRVVFVGPSLSRVQLRGDIVHSLTLEPPAKSGFVYRAASRGARVIGLVDGYFRNVAAVSHKEILWAISHGCVVVGAASIGALRAAELQRYGMIGVGSIFRGFAAGRLWRDDEVAVEHAPGKLSFLPTSEALVNIRYTVADGVESGALSPALALRLLRIGEEIFYPERTYEALVQRYNATWQHDQLNSAALHWLLANRINQKGKDAQELLELVSSLDPNRAPKVSRQIRFQDTVFFCELRESMDNPILRDLP
jgi:ribosomal protein S12 methylthiotransferase accessory factor